MKSAKNAWDTSSSFSRTRIREAKLRLHGQIELKENQMLLWPDKWNEIIVIQLIRHFI